VDNGISSWKFLLIKSLNTLNVTLGNAPDSDNAQTVGDSSNNIRNHIITVIWAENMQENIEGHINTKFLEIQLH